MKILQVGLGGFGRFHLEAWLQLGVRDSLWVCDLSAERRAFAERAGMAPDHIMSDWESMLPQVDVVDIVTPTDSHFALCQAALQQGKDVFVEKPMTMTSGQAVELAELCEQDDRRLQVGYYYRYHPMTLRLLSLIEQDRFGAIRYLTGNFCGFKRARTDVGVTHADAIHFLDLFNALTGSAPQDVFAVTRDHFNRGLEDFSVVLLTYPSGAVAKVESGYVQPGRRRDQVVPGAMTTKEITLVGARATAEVDFENQTLLVHEVHHELRQGVWAAVVGETVSVPIEVCSPVQLVARELQDFLDTVRTRQPARVGPRESGVALARLIEAIYESARTQSRVVLTAEAGVASSAS